MQRTISAFLLLTCLALSGCGVTGSLKTPPPLSFEKFKADTDDKKDDATQDRSDEDDLDIENNRELNDILEELDD